MISIQCEFLIFDSVLDLVVYTYIHCQNLAVIECSSNYELVHEFITMPKNFILKRKVMTY
jgi:hypothetical protein